MNIFKLLFISVIFSFSIYANQEIPSIVSVSWLSKNFDNKNLVIVDLRDEKEYKKSHIYRAVNIPALQNLFAKDYFMPSLNDLKEIISEAGIGHDNMVLAYDDGSFIWSARFYWILEVLGHNNVGILDVGFGNWDKNLLAISSKVHKNKRVEFTPRVDNTKLETKLSTLMGIGKKTIIDGRHKPHFDGKESTAIRYGHIPTALNYECTHNYEVTANGNKMKNLKDLKEIYKDIPKDKDIILYCDGGAEAALNYIVLKELGFKAAVYDGSWAEWGNDKNTPIQNPSKK